jgi:SAM-dependent methyltransferase
LGIKVANTTYDLDSHHLGEGVVQHDCTVPLPRKDFDITYAHVLLKFIPTKKQLELVKNSIDALAEGGIAIHVIDNNDIKAQGISDMYEVPLDKIKEYLKTNNLEYQIVNLKYGIALVIKKG